MTSLTPVAATKSRSTCSASPARSSPWSTKTQVNWSPTARWTSAAATAESTPPDSPQITRGRADLRADRGHLLGQDLAGGPVGRQPGDVVQEPRAAPPGRARSARPRGGTARRTARGSVLEAGDRGVGGAGRDGEAWRRLRRPSRRGSSRRSARRAGRQQGRRRGPPTSSAVPPYSRRPVRATRPPSALAMAWKP